MRFLSTELHLLRILKVFAGVCVVIVVAGYLYLHLTTPIWTKLRNGHTAVQAIEIMGEPTDRIYDPAGQLSELWYSAGVEQYKLVFSDGRLARLTIDGRGKGIRLKALNGLALRKR